MSPKRKPGWTPKLGWYGPRQCGRVRIPGRADVYLGAAGCWKSKKQKPPREVTEAYEREIARYLSARVESQEQGPDRVLSSDCSVVELCRAYLAHCQHYYQKRGKPTTQVNVVKNTLRPLRRLFGLTRAADFRAADFRAYRDHLEREGELARDTINARLARVRLMFRWAVEQELLAEDVWARLRAVQGLKKGRTTAREARKVPPVDDARVEATLPHLPAWAQACVRLQRLCGLRPEEVCGMRAHEIEDLGDGVWRYTVSADWNKTAHKEGARERVAYLGPQAQAVLGPHLEAARQRGADAPLWLTSLGTQASPNYYGRVIRSRCERHGIEPWAPNRLRHTRGTETRAKYGIEGTQSELGHSQVETSQIYAERLDELARKIARETG